MSRATAQPWRVVLIVEDDTDGRALRDLARASGFGVRIDWLPARTQLAAKASGIDAARSRSWSQAVGHLNRCPIGEP